MRTAIAADEPDPYRHPALHNPAAAINAASGGWTGTWTGSFTPAPALELLLRASLPAQPDQYAAIRALLAELRDGAQATGSRDFGRGVAYATYLIEDLLPKETR